MEKSLGCGGAVRMLEILEEELISAIGMIGVTSGGQVMP
jgi:hypothetical protein